MNQLMVSNLTCYSSNLPGHPKLLGSGSPAALHSQGDPVGSFFLDLHRRAGQKTRRGFWTSTIQGRAVGGIRLDGGTGLDAGTWWLVGWDLV